MLKEKPKKPLAELSDREICDLIDDHDNLVEHLKKQISYLSAAIAQSIEDKQAVEAELYSRMNQKPEK